MKKKTHEEYVTELAIKNTTVEVIGTYVDAKTKIEHHCLIHDIYWDMAPTNALRGAGCSECWEERKSEAVKKTHKQYVDELCNINTNIVVKEQYIDYHTPILHECLIHNIEWRISPSNALGGKGCRKCMSDKIKDKLSKTHEQYIDELKNVNPDIIPVEEYINNITPILHKCKIDGYEWYAIPSNMLNGRGCPQCNESSGERKVRQFLEKNNIEYEYQKPFKNCKDVNVLPFDFYLSDYNICIEYDGIQHFEPVDFAGKGKEWAEKQFEYTQKHDNIKNEYCKNNNIKLLRIPYWENVEETLNNFLFI